jgi:tetratricopeptide (TPR) repeat protein
VRRWVAAALLGSSIASAAPPRDEYREKLGQVDRLLEEENIPAAARALEGVKDLPEKEPVDYFAGRIAFEEGRYDDAIKLLRRAGIDDKPGSYLRLATDTQKAVAGHKTLESEHFIFSYPPGKDEVLAPYALETLEAQRQALLDDLGYAPPGKIRVEVVQDAAELSRLSTLTEKQINTTGTIAICKFNKLIITSPKAVVRGYDWQNTLAHEYTHLVVTQKGRNQVPIWLQEGLAKYLESRWSGPPGQDLEPASRALLGFRLKKDNLVSFAQMHPSMAMLASAEDAELAFAEVFLAIQYMQQTHGNGGLRQIIDGMAKGETDEAAVSSVMGVPFARFELDYLGYLRRQPYPPALLPRKDLTPQLKDGKAAKPEDKGREISFSDFGEVEEQTARKWAHLGELMRERSHNAAASEEYSKARAIVGDKYESISNKLALALLAQHKLDDAQRVLEGSLKIHPEVPATHVHLGRIELAQGDFPRAKAAYLTALGMDPFDPEIHFALLRIAEELKDDKLATRTRAAAKLLTGMPDDRIEQVAQMFVQPKQDLSAAPGSAPAKEPLQAVRGADAGTK